MRRATGDLSVRRSTDPLREAVAAVRAAGEGSVGLVVPDAAVRDAEKALRAADVAHSVLGDADDVDARLDLVPASLAKGLEFDHVVLVEPAAIVAAEADRGHRPAPALRLPDPRGHLADRAAHRPAADPARGVTGRAGS